MSAGRASQNRRRRRAHASGPHVDPARAGCGWSHQVRCLPFRAGRCCHCGPSSVSRSASQDCRNWRTRPSLTPPIQRQFRRRWRARYAAARSTTSSHRSRTTLHLSAQSLRWGRLRSASEPCSVCSPDIAAIGGLLLSLNLFLAVSFHTSPYYTGSDIVFVFAWMPFIIAGGGLLSLDALVANVVAARQSWSGASIDVDRRRVLGAVTFAAAAVAILGAGAAAGLGRLFNNASPTPSSDALSNGSNSPAVSSPAASSSVATQFSVERECSRTGADTRPHRQRHRRDQRRRPATATATAKPKPAGTKIGPATAVPVAGSAAFQDPASGDPAIVVQPKAGSFLGFDAVCPHAGCTVGYDQQRVRFVCPCHGSEFNGTTGAVENGPATRGLRRIPVAEGSDGQLYAK